MSQDWLVSKVIDQRISTTEKEYLVEWENTWTTRREAGRWQGQIVEQDRRTGRVLVRWQNSWVKEKDIAEDLIDLYVQQFEEDRHPPQNDAIPPPQEQQDPFDNIFDEPMVEPMEEPVEPVDRTLTPEDLAELVSNVVPCIPQDDIVNWFDFSYSLRGIKLANLHASGKPVPYVIKHRVTKAQKFICPTCFNARNKSSYYQKHDCVTHRRLPVPSQHIFNKYSK